MTPIEGGYCVQLLDGHHCVDVLRMAFNWRVVLSPRSPVPHLIAAHGWCYYGHGYTADGQPRTMASAYLAAVAAAQVWDGTGSPLGFDKQAF